MITICQIRSLGEFFYKIKELEGLLACCRKKLILHIPRTQSSNPVYNFSSGSATRLNPGTAIQSKNVHDI